MKILNCFCTELPNSGNPAGVIFDFPGDKIEKQKLAQKLQLPVIVFVDKADSSVPVLQFFYPNIEMNLCLHGALAAAFLLMQQRQTDRIVVSNAIGTSFQAIELEDQVVQIKVSEAPVSAYTPDQKILKQVLNLTDLGVILGGFPLAVASVGSPKLFVPLKSPEALAHLQPNFDLIKQWSLDNQINGLYVYAPESTTPLMLQARAFNPKTGQNEDAATGVAAAALSGLFKSNLIIKQGHFINKPSQLIITYHYPDKIYVGGKIIEHTKTISNRD